MKIDQVKELLLQSLEHEMGGVKVYTEALTCVQNGDLKKEWTKYLSQTREHVQKLQAVCEAMSIDAREETPGRKVLRQMGAGLVDTIKTAKSGGDPAAAELVACECVVIAETKDHLDWELIGECAKHYSGEGAKELKTTAKEIEDQEDEHLYHSRGYCRELWLKSLGLKAVLPPPEERKNVKTAIGAARAEQAAHHPSHR
jgi:rubrerythrin